MISLPVGFNYSEVISAFATLGTYVVGAYVVLFAGRVALKALRNG